MSDDVLTREDIKALTSKNALEWLSQKASDAESRSGHIIGGTNAQALYRKFREKMLDKRSYENDSGRY